MLAKQYTVKLPADYDMDIIRDRCVEVPADSTPGAA